MAFSLAVSPIPNIKAPQIYVTLRPLACEGACGAYDPSEGRGVQWASFLVSSGHLFRVLDPVNILYQPEDAHSTPGSKLRIPTRPPGFRCFSGFKSLFLWFLRVLRLRVFRVQGF